MSTASHLIEWTIRLVFICVWTSFVIVKMLIDIIRYGPKQYFNFPRRTVTPNCLLKDWNHAYAKLSSVKLHYVHVGDRKKPLMLFLHGFPEFWYSWRHQMREFSDDYWCVAVDMRGYNESDKPSDVSQYGVKWLSQDVKELVDALGYSSCVLVAHDWGGAVAWNVAMYYPEVVDKLIVMNCPHPVAFARTLTSNPTQMLKSWYMFFFQVPYLPELMMCARDYQAFDMLNEGTKKKAFTDEDIEAWKYVYSQPGAITGPLNYYRAAFRGKMSEGLKKADKTIDPPTLLIWGTKDLALDESMAHATPSLCRDCTLRLVQGASHWVQNDEPKQCHQFMRDFLHGK